MKESYSPKSNTASRNWTIIAEGVQLQNLKTLASTNLKSIASSLEMVSLSAFTDVLI